MGAVRASGVGLFSGTFLRSTEGRPIRRVVASAGAAVLFLLGPLVLLALLESRFTGFPGALVFDVGIWARFLVAVPLLVASHPLIDFVNDRVFSLLVAAEVLNPTTAARNRDRLRRDGTSAASDLTLLLLAVAVSLFVGRRVITDAHESWYVVATSTGRRLSLAGWWSLLVATPAALALIFGWMRRIGLWCALLARSESGLLLRAAHPDRVGGLGPLVRYHMFLAGVLLAFSTFMAGGLWMRLSLEEHQRAPLLWAVGTVVVGMTLFYLSPLLGLTLALVRARREALDRYGVLACHFARRFDDALLQSGGIGRKLLEEQAFSAHADMISSHDRIMRMRIVAVDTRLLVTGLVASSLPFLLVLARDVVYANVFDEALKMILKLLMP